MSSDEQAGRQERPVEATVGPACPTQHGTGPLYRPEYQDMDHKWHSVPVERSPHGVPAPLLHGGIAQTVGMYGYEQAMALAWTFAAAHAAERGLAPPVRVVKYRMEYDIKCWRIEPPNTGDQR